jgi:hypothetical protein
MADAKKLKVAKLRAVVTGKGKQWSFTVYRGDVCEGWITCYRMNWRISQAEKDNWSDEEIGQLKAECRRLMKSGGAKT